MESGRKSYASEKITDTALSGRPAWYLPQNTLHSVSWPWGLTNSPLTHGRQARSEIKTERPHMSLQWASKVIKLSIKTQTNWRRNIQPSIDMSVQRRPERSQLQAGRPTNYHASNRRNHYRPPGVIRSVHEKAVQIWQRSQAGRPRGGWPASLCHATCPSFV